MLRFDGCLWLEVGTGWADVVDRYSAFNEAAEIVRANAELIAAGGSARDDLVLIRSTAPRCRRPRATCSAR